jgi:hypothetical protein
MNLSDSTIFFLLINSILTLLLVLVGAITIFVSRYNSKWIKKIEITYSFLERFDKLIDEIDPSSTKYVEGGVPKFWKKFWYMQQEQYTYWAKGLIDKDIYDLWMCYRKEEYLNNKFMTLNNYNIHFNNIKSFLRPEFVKHMEKIFNIPNPQTNKKMKMKIKSKNPIESNKLSKTPTDSSLPA